MTETKAQHTPEWKIGLAKAQAHDWKITLWATDNYMVQGIAYQDGYNQAKAEDNALLEALQETTAHLNWWLRTSVHDEEVALRGQAGLDRIERAKETRNKANAAIARAAPGWTHTTASGEQKITGRGKETT